jgi:hypothetical protein
MEDSVTYQAIVEKGMIRARQEDLLIFGRKRFGPAGAANETALRGITDIERLARMIERLSEVSSWEELLATP